MSVFVSRTDECLCCAAAIPLALSKAGGKAAFGASLAKARPWHARKVAPGLQLASGFYCCLMEGLESVVQAHGAPQIMQYPSSSVDTKRGPWVKTKLRNLANVYDSIKLEELASIPVLPYRHSRVGVVFT